MYVCISSRRLDKRRSAIGEQCRSNYTTIETTGRARVHARGTMHNKCAWAGRGDGGGGGGGGGGEKEEEARRGTREEGIYRSVNCGKDAPAGWMLLSSDFCPRNESPTRKRRRYSARARARARTKIDNG